MTYLPHMFLKLSASPCVYGMSTYPTVGLGLEVLVSKIKPCMCKYKPVHGQTVNGSLNQLWFLRSLPSMDNCSNSRANTCTKALILQEKSTVLRPRLMYGFCCTLLW